MRITLFGAGHIGTTFSTVLAETGHDVVLYDIDTPRIASLTEGRLIDDFFRPDRVLVGCSDPTTRSILEDLYAPYLRTNSPLLFMDPTSAEVTKLTVNAILASRVSFINEIARLCDATGADVNHVRRGVGTDGRLGNSFLFPGIGYGGRRFPRDVRDLVAAGRQACAQVDLLSTTDQVNEAQRQLIAERIRERLGQDLTGRGYAIWGLSFKAGTDDLSEAPAVVVVEDLLSAGATVRVYDPVALDAARDLFTDRAQHSPDPYQACEDADGLVIAVEWSQFRQPDLVRLRTALKTPLVFDGKNVLDRQKAARTGLEVISIGTRARPSQDDH